jgi:predicted O-linked N-acetylglucosamine transferase (SPINDLY family)
MNQTLLDAALRSHRAGNLAEAGRLYSEILRADPRHLEALYRFALLHFQIGRFADSERLFSVAIRFYPDVPELFYGRGCTLQALRRFEEALASFARALVLRPNYIEARNNKGVTLLKMKRYQEAFAAFDMLSANDDYGRALILNNRAAALLGLGRYGEALDCSEKSLALKPDQAQSLSTYAAALGMLGRHDDALASYEKSLALDPTNPEVRNSRADMLVMLKRFDAAMADYERLLQDGFDVEYIQGNLAICRLHCCDWHDLDGLKSGIDAGLKAGRAVLQPFGSLMLTNSPGDQLRSAKIWVADRFPKQPALTSGERHTHERIRVAYVSGDFRDHPVATLLADVFESHDRSRFETIAVSFGLDDQSATRKRLKTAFDRFIDIEGMSDLDAARMLKDMEVDIAVDLAGYTGASRGAIFAMKPAPVQVNYLGYPGTLGTDRIDYIIADRTVIPEQHRSSYAENIVVLPDTCHPAQLPKIAASTPARTDAGLPETGFVFACFNNSYKFNPETFDIWMRLLKGVDGSVLWLSEPNTAAKHNLRREAESRGLSPERLVFAPFLPAIDEHLARLKLADLFLDTLPYNAHTTASDALKVGVPVLTSPGETFAGRVAASLLQAVGLPELIAPSLSEYESLALKLAREPDVLARLRAKLEKARGTSPLFDVVRYTRHLEAAFAEMHERFQRGDVPGPIEVTPIPS